jgi:hypothetical protein
MFPKKKKRSKGDFWVVPEEAEHKYEILKPFTAVGPFIPRPIWSDEIKDRKSWFNSKEIPQK